MTYIPMARGFLYLVAVMDWYSRKVLAWRLSNTLTADFCVEALEEALAHFGRPEIFNTDQGGQFTCGAFTDTLVEIEPRLTFGCRRTCRNVPHSACAEMRASGTPLSSFVRQLPQTGATLDACTENGTLRQCQRTDRFP